MEAPAPILVHLEGDNVGCSHKLIILASDVQPFILIFLYQLRKKKVNKLADISYKDRNYRVSRHQNRELCCIFLQDCYFSRLNSA